MFGSFPPSPLVGLRLQSLLGPGSRHCLWNHYTQNRLHPKPKGHRKCVEPPLPDQVVFRFVSRNNTATQQHFSTVGAFSSFASGKPHKEWNKPRWSSLRKRKNIYRGKRQGQPNGPCC